MLRKTLYYRKLYYQLSISPHKVLRLRRQLPLVAWEGEPEDRWPPFLPCYPGELHGHLALGLHQETEYLLTESLR